MSLTTLLLGAFIALTACASSKVPIYSTNTGEYPAIQESSGVTPSSSTDPYETSQDGQPYDYSKEETPTSTSAGGCNGGAYKIGNPYKIEGQWYYPHEEYGYQKTGAISWYGTEFHGKKTANGETFDMNQLSAAHQTLPLPSMVKVTNTANGRSVIVRVNDRGPFARDRIMDVSRRAAQILGFEGQGTTQARLEVLPEDSKRLKEEALACKAPSYPAATAAPTPLLPPVETNPYAPSGGLSASEQAAAPGSTMAAPIAAGTYYVQVASFPSRAAASGVEGKISTLGKTSVQEATVNGRQWYRVRLGPVQTESQARQLLEKAQAAGHTGARAIQDTGGTVKWIR